MHNKVLSSLNKCLGLTVLENMPFHCANHLMLVCTWRTVKGGIEAIDLEEDPVCLSCGWRWSPVSNLPVIVSPLFCLYRGGDLGYGRESMGDLVDGGRFYFMDGDGDFDIL